jgi:hypothetical protein
VRSLDVPILSTAGTTRRICGCVAHYGKISLASFKSQITLCACTNRSLVTCILQLIVFYYRFGEKKICVYDYHLYVSLAIYLQHQIPHCWTLNVDQPEQMNWYFGKNTKCPDLLDVVTHWRAEYCPYHTRPVSIFFNLVLNPLTSHCCVIPQSYCCPTLQRQDLVENVILEGKFTCR